MFLDCKRCTMREDGWLSMKRKINCSASIRELAVAKKIALRRGLWYRTLNRLERGIIDLTVRYVDNIRSSQLAQVVTAIIEKLQVSTGTLTDRMVRTVGLSLAQKISEIAVSWGNRSASKWADDRAFARFLLLNFAKTSLYSDA
jgi:hypothetical protein